jgi:hypothetical protein
MSKRVIVISKDEEIKDALNRALRFITCHEAVGFGGRFYRNTPVLYIHETDDAFDRWLCGQFRARALSTLIVLGVMKKEEFLQRYPIFRTYSQEHIYIKVPFELDELIEAIRSAKPIYDHATRRILYNDYCKNYEYKLITHDLKIIENDRNKTIEHFRNVLNYYKICGLRATADKIEKTLKEIATNDNWVELSERLKAELLERCKRRHGQ